MGCVQAEKVDYSNLIYLIQIGDTKQLKAKLNHNNIDQKVNNYGDTLLHYAAYRGN